MGFEGGGIRSDLARADGAHAGTLVHDGLGSSRSVPSEAEAEPFAPTITIGRAPEEHGSARVRRPVRGHRDGLSAQIWLMILAAAVVGGVAGGSVVAATRLGSSPGTVEVSVVHGAPGPATAQGASIPAIAAEALSSVVTVTATGPAEATQSGTTASVDEGSGMIIDDRGDILTNNHVVSGSVSITVTLHGGLGTLPAHVIGTDPGQDIALLGITDAPTGLVPVVFGDSTRVVVGDSVVAVGDALGLSPGVPTVTSGIVSALGRSVQPGDGSGSISGREKTLDGMIQTDAPINPGNSGGPLLDSAGRVIGMNTAVLSSGPDNTPAQGIGFAIPSARLVAMLPALERGNSPARPLLGVEAIDDSAELKSQDGLEVSSGAMIVGVDLGSPAASAGVRSGDVIVGFDSRGVASADELESDVESSEVGQRVTLELWRLGREMRVTATLASSSAAR